MLAKLYSFCFFFFFQAEDGIRDLIVTGVQTCALPIWLVRREFWENRAIWMIPAVTGGLMVLIALFGRVDLMSISPQMPVQAVGGGFLLAVGATFFAVMSIYSTWYLLDCLYADRKDRSVLFWKSMPISDTR